MWDADESICAETGTISDVKSIYHVVFSSGSLSKSDFSHINTLYTLNSPCEYGNFKGISSSYTNERVATKFSIGINLF